MAALSLHPRQQDDGDCHQDTPLGWRQVVPVAVFEVLPSTQLVQPASELLGIGRLVVEGVVLVEVAEVRVLVCHVIPRYVAVKFTVLESFSPGLTTPIGIVPAAPLSGVVLKPVQRNCVGLS